MIVGGRIGWGTSQHTKTHSKGKAMSEKLSGYEASQPDPQELGSYDTPTARHRSETYFRWGYQIDGGKPFMVEECGRSEVQAQKLAQLKAADVRDQLQCLGARLEVFAWIQQWQSQTVISYSDAKVVML